MVYRTKILGIMSIFLLIFSGCSLLEDPDNPIKQPGKPNVVQYASKMETEQWSYKVAHSIIRHGMPGYTLYEDGTVEILVEFDQSGATQDFARVVAQRHNGYLAPEQPDSKLFAIQVPQIDFWPLVKDPAVRRVGIPPPPENQLNRMVR